MKRFYFELSENMNTECEIHYSVNNMSEFIDFYSNIKQVVKEKRSESYQKSNLNHNMYRDIKETVLVNNLKIVSAQIERELGVRCSVEKQTKGDDYKNGNGVRNISILNLPYIKLIDLNMIVDKSAETILRDDFDKYCEIAERIIKENDGKVPKSVAALIRKKINEAYDSDKEYKNMQWKFKINSECLNFLRNWYKGGLCFVNKYWQGKEIRNVYHADMTSAYISQMIYQDFPLTSPKVYTIKSDDDRLKFVRNRFCLFECKCAKIKLKYWQVDPFNLERYKGEILYFTNLDFVIFEHMYEFEGLEINSEMLVFEKMGPLPNSIKAVMRGLFEDKQRLKSLKGTEQFDDIEYEIAKKRVNCSYGIFGSKNTDVKFSNIFWAIFTTAWQRYTLFQHIMLTGIENFVYCDTDSIFSVKQIIVQEGNELGKWEVSRHKRFLVKGCKGYIIEEFNGDFSVILAGANKENLKKYLKENNITVDYMFKNFANMTFPAEAELVYKYVCKDSEVYRKCYPYSETVGKTTLNILLDNLNIEAAEELKELL